MYVKYLCENLLCANYLFEDWLTVKYCAWKDPGLACVKKKEKKKYVLAFMTYKLGI